MATDKAFNLDDQTNLFKINYYKKSDNMFNSYNVLHGRVRKRHDFVGKQKFVSTPLSFSGGVGSGTIPKANNANYQGAIITAKKVYGVARIDRESVKAAKGKGAFVDATKEAVQKTVESYMRNCSRILFGTGDGVLGTGYATGADVVGNGSELTPYVVQIDEDNFIEANFEEKDYVQVVVAGTPETDLLEIVVVDPATRKISLVGTSARLAVHVAAPSAFAATDDLAMQGSYNKDPIGLRGIRDEATSIYSVPVQRRWQMHGKDALGEGISPNLMNEIILGTEKKFGKCGKLIITSYTQFQKILDFLEDQKVYNLPNRNLKGQMSFSGIEIMTSRGPAGIFVDRFCADDEMWFINEDYIEQHYRPGFGWFEDDGTMFLRASDGSDEYEARYGGYYENYITPTAHGYLKGLAV